SIQFGFEVSFYSGPPEASISDCGLPFQTLYLEQRPCHMMIKVSRSVKKTEINFQPKTNCLGVN
ncbi:MAG TPA: hypothetical protein VGN95_23095, partial [Pyrinomonadaceae bacterium]|nr:hypothetical protein [Pyrinomonadaceae bacterium]